MILGVLHFGFEWLFFGDCKGFLFFVDFEFWWVFGTLWILARFSCFVHDFGVFFCSSSIVVDFGF
jgi:hypothetical protein